MAVREDMYNLPLYEDSVNSLMSIGVSTHTQTTSTLTPTTLKTLEESLMDEYSGGIRTCQPQHEHQARFVTPIVNVTQYGNSASVVERLTATSGEDSLDSDDSMSKTYWNENHTTSDEFASSQHSSVSMSNVVKREPKTRCTSGRRPKNNEKLTPEEEAKRKVRRERNKQAAARCRKRRLDHTNNLMKDVQGLEEKKSALQNEYQILKSQKDELMLILNAHKNECKRSLFSL